MAYQWFDDFSEYGTGTAGRTAMLDGLVYSTLAGGGSLTRPEADPDPNVIGGRALFLGAGEGSDIQNALRIALPTPTAGKIGCHTRIWMSALPSGTSNRPTIFQWRTVLAATLCNVRVELNGSITVQNASTTIANSIVPLVSPRSWVHYEAWYNSSDGTGELYINGILKLSWTGGTTGTTALLCHSPSSTAGSGNSSVYLKDYGIWDATGSEDNDVIGTVQVGSVDPVADVTLGGWLPSTGTTGFDLLAKTAPNDTTYLSADDTPPAPMQYTFESIDPDVTSIRAVMSVARMRKTDGGDAKVQMSLSPNGTDWDDGADRPISSAFAYWFDISALSPDTSAPWTPIEFNNIIGQINRTE